MDCGTDPAAWYRKRFGKEPDYSEMLDVLTCSPTERRELLRSYFEPTASEREQGLKQPTPAHRAIAELAASGHIRVIVTTNFDRLMETALEDAGVVPAPIYSPDMADGALPLVHTQCTLIKIHGDYLDTRLKNTRAELEAYDERIDRLLDRVLDEFGMIVCGWSGEWDTALRAAIERCRTHRFGAFWASRGKLQPIAQTIVNHRRGSVIEIDSADSFFPALADKMASLDRLSEPHPATVEIAVESVKRYVAQDQYTIPLADLARTEFSRLAEKIPAVKPLESHDMRYPRLREQMQQYIAISRIPLAIISTGCRWGGPSHHGVWVDCLERAGNATSKYTESYFSAILLFYGAGICAVRAGRYDTLQALIGSPLEYGGTYSEPRRLVRELWRAADSDYWQNLHADRKHVPLSEFLAECLKEAQRDFFSHDRAYDNAFDRFELLGSLLEADISGTRPMGRFVYRSSIIDDINAEVGKFGGKWPPFEAGMFGGSLERFNKAREHLLHRVRAYPI